MNAIRASNWIEPSGGPIVLIPRSKLSSWSGTDLHDYDDACRVDDYAGVIDREWGQILVLNDEPLRTCVIHRGDDIAIVRWRYAPSSEALIRSACDFAGEQSAAVERLELDLGSEPYVMFDSARPGSNADGIEIRLGAGTYEVCTYLIEAGDDVAFVLHRFELGPSSD